MKSYYLTRDLLEELLYGTKSNKQKIVSKLEDLLKKNESLFISLININHILEKESNLETRKLILKNIDLVCEKILPPDKDDLPLALAMQTEFQVNHETALDLVTAGKFEMDYILTTSDRFQFQKMISVISLILESKLNTI
jgi:hypothetical protein